jgi:hypothetical protein
MKSLVVLVLALAAVIVAAPAHAATVTLSPSGGSSESGSATLTNEGGKTKVVLDVKGAEGTQPAHIHKGTCANLDPKPAYPLSPVTGGKSETMVNASLDDLQKGGYAINGHKSAQDLKTYVFCGEIKP